MKEAVAEGVVRNGHEAMMFFREIAAQLQVEILWNCVTTKSDCWKDQNETRLLALNILKAPRHKITIEEKRPRVRISQPLLKECLDEIMIGPEADAGIEERIRKFLSEQKLDHVKIIRSKVARPTGSSVKNSSSR